MAGEQRESGPYLGWLVAVLFLIQLFSIMDRLVLSVLGDDVKRDLGLSDSELGFLLGFAFAVFYATVGIPVARLADRRSRRGVAAVSVGLWSLATAATGLAHGFWQLALARVFVGIGEAGGSPPSHSLVADYFPPERRGRVLGITSAGGSMGVLAGIFLGGHLGELIGWRATFFVIGAAGLVFAAVIRWTVREPERGRFDPPGVERATQSLATVLRFMLGLRSYVHLSLAASLHSFAGYGASAWTPIFLIRVHGLDKADVANTLAPISGTLGMLGILASGFAVDWLSKRDVRWYMWLPAITSMIALPFSFGFLLAPNLWLAFALMAPSALLGAVYAAPTWAMVQGLAKPAMRATASAVTLLVLNLIGFGLGPWLVGILNDGLNERFGAASVRYSLLIIGAFHVWGAIHNWLAARTLRQDLSAQ
jgi:predicted MFS family arabinose efflux permease